MSLWKAARHGLDKPGMPAAGEKRSWQGAILHPSRSSNFFRRELPARLTTGTRIGLRQKGVRMTQNKPWLAGFG